MIKIGNDYEVTADKYQFILNTRSDGKDKDDQPKAVWNKTFHASFDQLGKAVINNEMINMIGGPLNKDLRLFMDDMHQISKQIAEEIEVLQPHNKG